MQQMLLIIALMLPLTAWAAPRQVTLFPASALVEELANLNPKPAEGGFAVAVLTLPGQADPATLRFDKLQGNATIADLSWSLRAEQNQSALAPLNSRLAELKAKRNVMSATVEGIRGRVAFWKAQTQAGNTPLATIRELAMELGLALQQETEKLLGEEQRLTELNSEILNVEAEIAKTAGQERKVWDIRILFAGSAPRELAYAYTLSDCGWSPVYRLEALPGQKRIDFSWQAKVWQRSGQDWNGTRLHLATMQPDSQSAPSELPPWEIRPVQIFRKAMTAPAMMEMKAGADEMSPAAPAAPMEIRHSTYAAWDMGTRSLPAGETRIFDIARELWPAGFVHLLRPSLDLKAYLQANAEFTQPKELPAGDAFFLIDGATIDRRPFAFSGRNATLFFGTDPLVLAETTLKDKKTGEKGLFNQRQTFIREWTVTVRNASKHPVQIRVEEPRPLIRDERITLALITSPKPLEEGSPEIIAWNSTVAAGGESSIALGVTIETPNDLRIDPGWRW